jgi:hypothetical protein
MGGVGQRITEKKIKKQVGGTNPEQVCKGQGTRNRCMDETRTQLSNFDQEQS